MMKKTTNEKRFILIFMAVAIVGTTGYFVWKKYQNGKSGQNSLSSGGSSSNSTDGSTTSAFPLKYGSRGSYVKHLQAWLNATSSEAIGVTMNYDPTIHPHPAVEVDGIFGPKTEASVKAATNMPYVTESYYYLKQMQNY